MPAVDHVGTALAHLADHWMLPVRIRDLVALGPLGRSRFLAAFRRRAGCAPGTWLARRRLAEAERRLRAGEPIVAVALACGYASQSHFHRRFQAVHGCAPGAWRRRAVDEQASR